MTGDHDYHKRALLHASLIALAGLMTVGFGVAPPALGWTVAPADIQLSGRPGVITRGSFEVITSDSVGRQFRVEAQNLGETTSGSFTFTSAKHSAADWVNILPSSFQGSRQPQSVDYAIAVPSNASPGDHVAAISVQELPASSQGNLGVVEAVGIRLVIRVPGKLYPGVKITRFSAPGLTFGNGVPISATVVNTGDTILDFNGANSGSAITVAGQTFPMLGLLLPGATRTLSYGWNDPPLLGSTTAHLQVKLGTHALLTASTSIFAFPLYQLIGAILLVLAGYVYKRQRKRRRQNRTSSNPSDIVVGSA
ncbi:MAG TPA: hypothetical protein VID48_08315 [Solirubrobacteraceae bacterium]|jgi:hypothetical protein